MPFINIRDVSYYYEFENQKTETIVLISGLKADHTSWATIVPELSKQYNVLTIDNRGIGQTKDNRKSFEIDDLADDILEIIYELKIDRPHIVGHSMGGAIAQSLAYKYPDKIASATFCNTFIKFNQEAAKFFSEDVEKLYANGKSQGEIMEAIIPWVFDESFINPELVALIKKMSDENLYPQSMEDYRRQCDALCKFDSARWISLLQVPTLVIGSSEDKTATLEESKLLHQSIPKSELKLLKGGHASAVEQTMPLLDALLSFCNAQNLIYKKVSLK